MPSTAAKAEAADPEPAGPGPLESRPLLVYSLLALLVAQFVVLGLVQAREDAFTFDEPFYAVAGSTALRERDLRINFEHPPLPKVLAAIPAEIWGDVEIPMDTGAWDRGDTWALSLEMYQANLDDIEWVTFLYRIVPTLIAAATGVLLFLLGRRLFGTVAGLLAGGLWLTAPIALGYGHLNGLDVPAAFTVVLTLWLLARYVQQPTLINLAFVAASVGVALLTRAAVGLVVAGAAFAVVLLVGLVRREWLTAPLKAAAVLVAGWLIVWGGYLLIAPEQVGMPILDGHPQRLMTQPPASLPGQIALSVPWPVGFEAGIRFLTDFHQNGESSGYLFGQHFTGAPDWFWLGSFALKMTLVSMAMIVVGAVAWFTLDRTRFATAALVLAPMLLGLMAMMAFAERPFGARYLVPIVVILLVGAAVVGRHAGRRAVAIALVAALLVQTGALWSSHPYTFAWSNPLLRESWQLAADSNVDWGQDFHRLQEWAAEQDETVWISYFGFGPSFALDEIPNAVSAHPDNVWGPYRKPPGTVTTYAVSASNLNAFVGERIGYLRTQCPVEIIGQTILVYRFEEAPWGGLSLMGPVDGIPVPPCEGEPYSHYVEQPEG